MRMHNTSKKMPPARRWLCGCCKQIQLEQVGVVSAANGGAFHVLSNAEVEVHLTAISERD